MFPNVTLDFDQYNLLAETLGTAPQVFARALQSALSSASFLLRKRLIQAVDSNRLGWAPLRVYTPTGHIMRSALMAKGDSESPLFGRLVKTIVYSVDKQKLRSEIGVLQGTFGNKTVSTKMGKKKVPNVIGSSAQESAEAFQLGMTRQVTPSMRRYFFARGVPLSLTTTQLQAPRRPLFAPVFEQDVELIKQLMWVVFSDKITNGFTHGVAA